MWAGNSSPKFIATPPGCVEQLPLPVRLPVISNPFSACWASLLHTHAACFVTAIQETITRRFGRFLRRRPVRRHQIPEGLSLHRSYAAIVM